MTVHRRLPCICGATENKCIVGKNGQIIFLRRFTCQQYWQCWQCWQCWCVEKNTKCTQKGHVMCEKIWWQVRPLSKSPLPEPRLVSYENDRPTNKLSHRQINRDRVKNGYRLKAWIDKLIRHRRGQKGRRVGYIWQRTGRYTHLLYQTKGISVMVYLREAAPSPTPCRSVRTPWAWEHAVESNTHGKERKG